jgi:hypothetical protein
MAPPSVFLPHRFVKIPVVVTLDQPALVTTSFTPVGNEADLVQRLKWYIVINDGGSSKPRQNFRYLYGLLS